MQEKVSFEYRDILKNPPRAEELEDLAQRGGFPVTGLLNERSRVFKGLGREVSSVSETEAANLIRLNPRVMFRPLFTDGSRLVVGFEPEKFRELADSALNKEKG